jgi:hypothetical protein
MKDASTFIAEILLPFSSNHAGFIRSQDSIVNGALVIARLATGIRPVGRKTHIEQPSVRMISQGGEALPKSTQELVQCLGPGRATLRRRAS